VLSTLHTGDVVQSVTRLVDSAPASAKSYYRQMLSASLRGVLCQRLLPCKNGGRVAAYEFMRVNNVIKGQIYGDTAIQIKNSISQAVSEGMFLLHRNLAELFTNGQITEETAIDALEHSDEEIKQYRNQLDVLKKDKQKFNSPIKK
jgi:twitching motility protein PilT